MWIDAHACSANKQQLGTPRFAGEGCRFHSCTTNVYKLHYLELPTGFKVRPLASCWVMAAIEALSWSPPLELSGHFLCAWRCAQLVLNTSRDVGDLREVLAALYDELLVERLVKNPAYTPGAALPK